MSEPEDDIDVLAGEHMLGLLSAAALAQIEHDPRFQQAVQNWSMRLGPLTEALPAQTPPAHVWARIEAATAPPRVQGGAGAKFWRGFGLGAGGVGAAGLALAAALVFAILPPRQPQAPRNVAMLTTVAEGSFIATAAPAGAGMQLIVSPAGASVPAGKSAELWLLQPGAKPMPLGLLSTNGPVTMQVALASMTGAKLAISLEPPGGSPTGLPTGPVIAAAKFLPLAASIQGSAS